MPFLLIWGARDPIIPVAHGGAAHRQVPGSELVVFPGAGHFPQLDDPERFVEVLTEFIDTTVPADVDGSEWGDLLRAGAPVQPVPRR